MRQVTNKMGGGYPFLKVSFQLKDLLIDFE